MTPLRIAVLGAADIATRRFLPAIAGRDDAVCVGIAAATAAERGESADTATIEASGKRTAAAAAQAGVALIDGYAAAITSPDVDAVYVPLPPALHLRWAREAVDAGKHVLVEKPFTCSPDDSRALLTAARDAGVAACENYAFIHHAQIDAIEELLRDGVVGSIRQIRCDFGIPHLGEGDKRYTSTWGGSLLECGGYPVYMASRLLGPTARVVAASFGYDAAGGTDRFGSAMLVSDDGVAAQIGFGMDDDYRCSLEVWGSAGRLESDRVYTAPAGFTPNATLYRNGQATVLALPADDAFANAIGHFVRCCADTEVRADAERALLRQADLVAAVAAAGDRR